MVVGDIWPQLFHRDLLQGLTKLHNNRREQNVCLPYIMLQIANGHKCAMQLQYRIVDEQE